MNLPEPDALSVDKSIQLTRIIQDKIRAEGSLSFADYMNMVLYYPQLGYYISQVAFGDNGDFITAPELSPLFGYTLANYIATTLPNLPAKTILEFGAGSGKLAADILLRLEALNTLPDAYFILDLSPRLQALQKETLAQRCPHLMGRVSWLTELPEKISGFILANEVLDAMPVALFEWSQGQLFEKQVDCCEGQFCFVTVPGSAQISQALSPYVAHFREGYTSEYGEVAVAWLNTLSAHCEQVEILLIDYGHTDTLYYHPERTQGTLLCHYRHHAHADPFLWPGLQDITSHVNFSLIQETALSLGWKIKRFETQANFLLEHGLLALAEMTDSVSQYEIAQVLKRWLLPTEMGEAFKILCLTTT